MRFELKFLFVIQRNCYNILFEYTNLFEHCFKNLNEDENINTFKYSILLYLIKIYYNTLNNTSIYNKNETKYVKFINRHD